jgi:hypothetical protein
VFNDINARMGLCAQLEDHMHACMFTHLILHILSAGVAGRLRRRFGSEGNLKGKPSSGTQTGSQADLIKTVMETGSGDNKALAAKIHQRYDKCVVRCQMALVAVNSQPGVALATPDKALAFGPSMPCRLSRNEVCIGYLVIMKARAWTCELDTCQWQPDTLE